MTRLAFVLYILVTGLAFGQTWDTTADQLDTDGNHINQFEGCVMYDPPSGYWYKYGTDYDSGGPGGLYVYKSSDFLTWKKVASYGYLGFRVSVLYNALNRNYVLWASGTTADNGKTSYVSSSPSGPFVRVNSYDSWQGTSIDIGDSSAYLDPNTGNGYFLTECSGNTAFMVVQLSPDFQSLTSTYALTTNSDGEAPTMWSNGPNSYFLMESFQTGWGTNENEYHWASSPLGPWESFQYDGINPFQVAEISQTPGEVMSGITASANNAYDTQTCQVLNIPNNGFLYFGDRYDNWGNTGSRFPNYRRIVLPINQAGKVFSINWQPTWAFVPVSAVSTPTPRPTPMPTSSPSPAISPTPTPPPPSLQGYVNPDYSDPGYKNVNVTYALTNGGLPSIGTVVLNGSGTVNARVSWPAPGVTQWSTVTANGQVLKEYDQWAPWGTPATVVILSWPVTSSPTVFTVTNIPVSTPTPSPDPTPVPTVTPTPTRPPTPSPTPSPSVTPQSGPPLGYIQDFDSNFNVNPWPGILDWNTLAAYDINNWKLPRFTSQQPNDQGNAGAAVYVNGQGDDPTGQPSPFYSAYGHLYINTWTVNGKWYTGMISTVDTYSNGFSAVGGYWEAQIQVPISGPPISGMWPAFWLYDLNTNQRNARTDNAIEIDIFEGYGTNPTGDNQLVHLWTTDGRDVANVPHNTYQLSGWNGMATLHTYGCLVNTDLIHYYVDGVDVFDTPAPPEVATHPLYAMVDMALQWGLVTGTSSTMAVQYVKHWKAPPALNAATAQPAK